MAENHFVDHELLSALADGELLGDDFRRAVSLLRESEQALAVWRSYHVVGDILRCADIGIAQDEAAFLGRLRPALALHHGAASVPSAAATGAQQSSAARGQQMDRRTAANDPVTRWKWFAATASMAAVGVLAWHFGVLQQPAGQLSRLFGPAGQEVAAGSKAEPVTLPPAIEPGVMLRDARLDELMAAHKQLGGTSALQMPSGFLRNATFENQGRRESR